jgi:hypothetical protein
VISENSHDEQRKVIKYNHLVANCLIFHNVCSLTRIGRELHADGKEVPEDALACISPYLTEHVNRLAITLSIWIGNHHNRTIALLYGRFALSQPVESGPFSGESLPYLVFCRVLSESRDDKPRQSEERASVPTPTW